MMSEKRFTGKMLVATNGEEFGFTIYDEDKRMSIDEVVDCLNEQQATINELKEAIDYLKTVIRYTIPNEMVADVFKQIGEEYE